MLRALRRLWAAIPHDPRLRWALSLVNLAGAVYGFAWYRAQLAQTPWWLWPVVPDSPLSALLFALTVVPRWQARRGGQAVLAAVARLATLKYGLWAVLVLGGAALRQRALDPETALLLVTHAGMAVEAWLFLRAEPPPPGARSVALLWLAVNDACDYGPLRTHPRLPDPAAWPYVAAEAVALTAGAWLVARWADRGRPLARPGPVW